MYVKSFIEVLLKRLFDIKGFILNYKSFVTMVYMYIIITDVLKYYNINK